MSPATSPPGVDLRVDGLSPFFTPTNTFYRVDTALLAPSVTADAWRLSVHGMVDRELVLTYAELLARPMIERDVTLTCVSNPVAAARLAEILGGSIKLHLRPGGGTVADIQVDAPEPAADDLKPGPVPHLAAG